jgi:hypothetical protein
MTKKRTRKRKLPVHVISKIQPELVAVVANVVAPEEVVKEEHIVAAIPISWWDRIVEHWKSGKVY